MFVGTTPLFFIFSLVRLFFEMVDDAALIFKVFYKQSWDFGFLEPAETIGFRSIPPFEVKILAG
jgi:hypothetical protein